MEWGQTVHLRHFQQLRIRQTDAAADAVPDDGKTHHAANQHRNVVPVQPDQHQNGEGSHRRGLHGSHGRCNQGIQQAALFRQHCQHHTQQYRTGYTQQNPADGYRRCLPKGGCHRHAAQAPEHLHRCWQQQRVIQRQRCQIPDCCPKKQCRKAVSFGTLLPVHPLKMQ